MKQLASVFLALLACCAVVSNASSEELPAFEKLLLKEPDWALQKKGAYKVQNSEHSWASFTNTKTGDILSFMADKYGKIEKSPIVRGGFVEQGATTGFPGGIPMPMFKKSEESKQIGWSPTEVIRMQVIPWEPNSSDGAKAQKSDLLEWTHVYEDDREPDTPGSPRPTLMAHGYALWIDGTVIFLQHTSSHIITSEFAKEIAMALLRRRS